MSFSHNIYFNFQQNFFIDQEQMIRSKKIIDEEQPKIDSYIDGSSDYLPLVYVKILQKIEVNFVQNGHRKQAI